MRAEELRIGNWVEIIDSEGVYTTVTKSTFDCDVEVFYEPIQITEEWLLKFGFKRTFEKLKGCYVDKHGKYMLCDNNENGFDIYIFGYDEDLYINSINYIHQLQNLYFALTGEELICK